MKAILLILLLLSFNISTALAQKSFHTIEGNCFTGIIVPSEAIFPFFKAKGRFTPGSDIVVKAEDELSKNLTSILKKEDNCAIKSYKDLRSYKRQYFGYTEHGRKILFISFIKTKDSSWKKGVIITEGGGCNYLQIKYEPTSNRIFDFHVNSVE